MNSDQNNLPCITDNITGSADSNGLASNLLSLLADPQNFKAVFLLHAISESVEGGLKLEISGGIEIKSSESIATLPPDDPEWKDMMILAGAVRCELVLTPLEYAILQIIKENFLTYYPYKNQKEDLPPARKSAKNVPSKDCLEITHQLASGLLGDPERLKSLVAKGSRKNQAARDKVLKKWPHLKDKASAHPTEDPDSHRLFIALAVALEDYVQRKDALATSCLQYALRNEELMAKLNQVELERDHFLRCLEQGPELMNYEGTINYLRQEIITLGKKLQATNSLPH